jgi:lysozyme family protein
LNDNFKWAMKFTTRWEGGLSNHSADPGGMTYRGISRRFHPKWEGWKFVDLKEFTEADKYVDEFYKKNYWDPSGCDNYDFPLACSVFDAAVNCGVKRSLNWLEVSPSAEAFNYMRERYYDLLVQKRPTLKVFHKGWLNRLNDLRKYINGST